MSISTSLSAEETLKQASAERDAGRLDEAERLYRSVLKENPQDAKAKKELRKLLKGQGKPAKGSRRKNKPARKTRLAKAGSLPVQKTILPQPTAKPAQEDIQALVSLYKAGQLREAETRARLLIEKFPGAPVPFAILGAALAGQGKFEEAVASYRKALEIEPDEAEIHNNLGNALNGLGKLNEAAASYQQALTIRPDFAAAHNNLGVALYKLGRPSEAIVCYQLALKIKSDYDSALANFAHAVQIIGAVNPSPGFRDLVTRCFQNPSIDSAKVSAAGMKLLLLDLQGPIDAGINVFDDVGALVASTSGLLTVCLKNALVNDPDIERVLTGVRRVVLERRDGALLMGATPPEEMELLEALAFQGFLNEYIWHVTEDEEHALNRLESKVVNAVEDGAKPGQAALFQLAAYRPLCTINTIRQWALDNFDEIDAVIKPVLRQLVVNPAREVEIRDDLERLTPVEDDLSLAVRNQYEEHPYPRWDTLTALRPITYTKLILQEIAPHRPALVSDTESPRVLIAGCGTGKQPISRALRLSGSEVLAVDLSRASLAFAKRKADEFQVRNIRFAQADILKLGELTNRFDVIYCSGVLHHMADPEAGLEALLSLLKPGGYMKIGLYSEIARRHIRQSRKIVSEKKFKPSLQGMRDFRAWVKASDTSDARTIQKSNDFYSASTLRDLVFHIQEHRFTVPQISALLDSHKLDFLGFIFVNPRVKGAYAKRFPNDPNCLDLDNWHLYEQDNPRMFAAMYQFWCRKGI